MTILPNLEAIREKVYSGEFGGDDALELIAVIERLRADKKSLEATCDWWAEEAERWAVRRRELERTATKLGALARQFAEALGVTPAPLLVKAYNAYLAYQTQEVTPLLGHRCKKEEP